MDKPTQRNAARSGLGQCKFLCGQKGKFGLNCQAVADADGRFLEILMGYGGSTSDLLAFEGSSFFTRLEQGLLLPGFCIFGDNAYLNALYLATPYSNVSSRSKDNYNFYHSQLHICVK